jgi:hypothetical protein
MFYLVVAPHAIERAPVAAFVAWLREQIAGDKRADAGLLHHGKTRPRRQHSRSR